jgi:hypothetical protein
VTAPCSGMNEDHCCYLDGKVCVFLLENSNGRRWSCSLRAKLGSWDSVHRDSKYLTVVKPSLDKLDLPDCGDWPRFGERCEVCGVVGGSS